MVRVLSILIYLMMYAKSFRSLLRSQGKTTALYGFPQCFFHISHACPPTYYTALPATRRWKPCYSSANSFSSEEQESTIVSDGRYDEPTKISRRLYLFVPFEDKDLVKSMGCYWDPTRKLWYKTLMPDDEVDGMSSFDPWRTKTYMNVPFDDKDAVKELGAKWDGLEKKWYYFGRDDETASKFSQWTVAEVVTGEEEVVQVEEPLPLKV